jgi:hypothetical protein
MLIILRSAVFIIYFASLFLNIWNDDVFSYYLLAVVLFMKYAGFVA